MSGRIDIIKPAAGDVKLWHYMDFYKFAALLQNKALWLSRLDCFQDKYEGWLPRSVRDALSALVVENQGYGSFTYPELQKRVCASCWHINEHESIAMWALYSPKAGIAVCSRVSLIRKAILKDFDPGAWGLYGNVVRYTDLATYEELLLNARTGRPVVKASELHLKRHGFAHEREYRLTSTLENVEEGTPGKLVPVDLTVLIEDIRLSPSAEEWMRAVVQKVVYLHGFNFEVTRSNLDDAVES
jgi:hypothetical protein